MGTVLCIAYIAAGYWAYGRVFEYNKTVIYADGFYYYMKKIVLGAMLGFLLIPAAIIRSIFKI